MSPEEQHRIKLLRGLSRLQDEEAGVRAISQSLHERWREEVEPQQLPDKTSSKTGARAKGLDERHLRPLMDRVRAVQEAWLERKEQLGDLCLAPIEAEVETETKAAS